MGWACVSTRWVCRVTKSTAFLSYKRVREVQGEKSEEMKNWRCRRLMEQLTKLSREDKQGLRTQAGR